LQEAELVVEEITPEEAEEADIENLKTQLSLQQDLH
jgi:hypothetical protein